MDAKKPVPDVPSIQEMEGLSLRYKEPEVRALFDFLYCTGARITEALNVSPRDLSVHSLKDIGGIVKVRLITMKNRRNKFREIPIITKGMEKNMIDFIFEFMEKKNPEDKLFKMSRHVAWNHLAKQSIKVRAFLGKEILDEYKLRIYPHYLRHCRCTHLVNVYGMREMQLVRYMGWSNSKPAQIYYHSDWIGMVMDMRGFNG